MLLAQVWAVLISAPILPALRLEVAGRAAVGPCAVSLPLLIERVPPLAADGHDPVALLVERGRAAGVIRPSRRTENRAPTSPASGFGPRRPTSCVSAFPAMPAAPEQWIIPLHRQLLGTDGLRPSAPTNHGSLR